ncbi:hypothetical protein [Paenibacillus mesotrionivorans]|uniref:Uncharacterized protein n=1 Tax=Paenibacillus mesotrionivorans TaxID=3160968 RepID=A0ACC7NYD1_9BACL
MSALFGLLLFVCFITLIIGLIKPSIVFKWGQLEKRTRGKVFLYYGLTLIVLFIVTIATAPEIENESKATVAKAEQTVSPSTDAGNQTKVEDKAKKEAEEKAKAEEKVKNEAAAKTSKEAEAKAKEEAKTKEKEDKLRNPAWNKNEVDAIENGNLQRAMDMLKVIKDIPSGEQASPEEVLKTPWNYYGKAISFTGQVGVVEDYPPGSDAGKAGLGSDVVMETDDGTIVEFFSMVASGSIKVGQTITITGYPIGRTEVGNKIGGKFTHLIVVTNKLN